MSRKETKKQFFLNRYRVLGHRLIGDAPPQAIRVNTLKTSDAEITETLRGLCVKLAKVPYLDHGYVGYGRYETSAGIHVIRNLFDLGDFLRREG